MAELFDLYGGVELTSLDGQYGIYVVETDGTGDPLRSRFVTLATLKNYINTDPTVVPSAAPWRGARARLTAVQSIANATFTTVSWQDEDIDTDSIWSIGAPTRLTVPSGVNKVRLSSNIVWDTSASGERQVGILMNGSTFDGGFVSNAPAVASVSGINATTGVVEVSSGDYFELRVAQTSGGSLSLFNDSRTWFEMEVVEASS